MVSRFRYFLRVSGMRTLIVGLLMAASGLGAQDSVRARNGWCFVPRDGSRCKGYAIVEVGVARALNSTTSQLYYDPGLVATKTDFETVVHAAFGLARNFGNRKSLGVAMIVDDFTHHATGFGGVELRYRDWVDTTNVAVEWQLGYSRPEYETVRPSRLTFEFRRFHGVRAGTALMLGQYGTVFMRGDLSNSGGTKHVGFFAGAGATSYTSIYSVLVVGVAAVAVLFLFPPYT